MLWLGEELGLEVGKRRVYRPVARVRKLLVQRPGGMTSMMLKLGLTSLSREVVAVGTVEEVGVGALFIPWLFRPRSARVKLSILIRVHEALLPRVLPICAVLARVGPGLHV